MKKCVIYSNCQADGLALFLPKMGFPYEITVYRNYQMILGEQRIEDLQRDAATADLFIFQPTNDKHGDSSSENMIELIPVGCKVISFAYVYNHGLHPLTEHGGRFVGSEFMADDYWLLDLPQLLYLYDRGEIDFALWPRFLHCLAEQARREQDTDIKITKWMFDHRERRILLNVNHPTTLMFVEIAKQIMQFLDILPDWRDAPGLYDDENRTGLPCTIPFSEYVRKEFHSYRDTDPEAHDFYRGLLAKAWEKENDNRTT